MFWIGIGVSVLLVIGVSVLVGASMARGGGKPLTRAERMTALKASGALKHRKSGR